MAAAMPDAIHPAHDPFAPCSCGAYMASGGCTDPECGSGEWVLVGTLPARNSGQAFSADGGRVYTPKPAERAG